jgi:hypothetical protein
MSAIGVLPIRLFCDLAARNEPVMDVNTGQGPLFYRGDDVEIDIGIGEGGVLLPPTLSNITSVTCQVFRGQSDANAPLMSCTVAAAAMNLTLTAAQWTAASAAPQAAFIFANAQTYITLNGAASQNYWLRITLLTADATAKVMTLLEGPVTVLDGPVSQAPASSVGNVRFMTVNGVPVLQIRNDSDGLFYTVGIEDGAGGAPAIYLSDVGSN